jgi:hypothetical protein
MKRKSIILPALFSILFLFTTCTKDCELTLDTCRETPPTEDCKASFDRWFYDESKNKCEQIGYSGCSQKGFATKTECEACKCG